MTATMSDQTNPAQRLLEIFSEARETRHLFINGWARVFDIRPFEPSANDKQVPRDVEIEVLEHLTELSRLIDDTEKKVREVVGEDAEDYLVPFPRLRAVIRMQYLQHTLADATASVTDSDLTVLRFCSKTLARHFAEPRLDEDLKAISQEIDELYGQVLEAELPAELKSLLLDLLHALRTTVHEARVRGADRLREGIESILGKLAVNRETAAAVSATEEGGRFSRIFWKTVSLTKFAPGVWKVIETVAPAVTLLLGSGPTDSDVPPRPLE